MRTTPATFRHLDELRQRLRGEVQVDRLQRGLHATDASIYQEWPLAIARPRDATDLASCAAWAERTGIPLTARAAGTSLAGQTTGGGLILDCGRHLTRVGRLDVAVRRIRVEPGVILDDLNDALAPAGLCFAPDTSTGNRCMIGGMIGNNSCGSHSCVYGTTRDHVSTIDAVLADGSQVRFAELDEAGLRTRLGQDDREGAIYRGLDALLREHRTRILHCYPDPAVTRRNTGYALDLLARMRPWDPAGAPLNLARFLCGSEGTLALSAAAELALVPRSRHRQVCAVHFASLVDACRAAVLARAHRCHAAELIDGTILATTRQNREQRRNRSWIIGDPGAICAIELEDPDQRQLEQRMAALLADLQGAGLGHAWPVLQGAEAERLWAVRKAGLGLLMGIPAERKAVAVIEDTAVAPADLPAYTADLLALAARMQITLVAFGHAAAGEIHFRPELDLREPRDARRFAELAERVADLVARYRGSLSGEHGDGRVRAPLIGRVLGEAMLPLLRRVKQLFDPCGILNPGKIVDPLPLDRDWRTVPGSTRAAPDTVFDWSASLGLVGAVEQCNGAGVCRSSVGRGTMCPSWQATGEELHTTRGRANTLRLLLAEADPIAALCRDEAAAALDLCLSCKACASECPANVDMARLKAEVSQQRHDRLGIPAADRRFGRFDRLARLARLAPRTISWLADRQVVKRLLGIHPLRSVPAFATETASTWWRRTGRHQVRGTRPLLLLVDEFSDHLEPGIVQAATTVLDRLDWRVELLSVSSARAQLSRGLVREAREILDRELARLEPALAQDRPVLAIEPSAAAVFWDEAPDLLSGPRRELARELAGRLQLVDEFLAEQSTGLAALPWQVPPDTRVLLHGHCHQKALRQVQASADVLAAIPGVAVALLDTGCCGMAGSFGYEATKFDLSMAIGELLLFPALRRDPHALVAATGHSCRHQIHDGSGRRARHPIELLAGWLAPEEGGDGKTAET